LYFYGARWYDPVIGRFIQADTIVPEPGNPQALNRYSYVLENPLRYTDPTGHAFDAGGGAGDLEAWMRLLPQNPSRAFNGWLHERDVAWAVLLYNQRQGASPEVIADLQAGLASREANLTTNGYRGAAQAVSAAFDAAAPGVGPGLLGFTAGLSALGAPALMPIPKGINPRTGAIVSLVTEEEWVLYRVWGDNAPREGKWLTNFQPTWQGEARGLLALPPDNSARFVSEVRVPAGTRIQLSCAASAFGQAGGALQVELLEPIPSSAFGPGRPLPAGLLSIP